MTTDRTPYMRDYRKRPGRRARDRWWNNTRDAAYKRLEEEYPHRFLELLAEERKKTPRPEGMQNRRGRPAEGTG